MTPDALERLVGAAARRASGGGDVPSADVRRSKAGSGADFVSPIPTRLAGRAGSTPERLAGRIAQALVEDPAIVAAAPTPGGFVEITLTNAARYAVVTSASRGWEYLSVLAPGAHDAGSPDDPAPWPRRALEDAPSLHEAAKWARADARERLTLYCGPTGPTQVNPIHGGGSWRDPYLDEPSRGGPVADLLAVVGEAAVRIAGCVAAEPAPTATHPGVWERQIAENPAFALRYAHAHAHTSVHSWGVGMGVVPGARPDSVEAVRLLGCPAAAHTVGVLFEGPGTVRSTHHRGRPSILVRYLEELAAAYREWTRTASAAPAPAHPPAAGGTPPRDPRLDLSLAVAGVLGTGLFLLGVPAPTEL
ncbi:anticodon-binding protein [Spiractinospora alimapuensis]|uniref:DALR anticodon-binding domain-containing protein n=1 Tax=Spiractinospora alimapuensis TaxID=2820884 RepID=UPI001F16BD75|nr:DALR anticodon-binding domain-containing protein [Spiractinospora alimapuensis]QVQ54250.1 anticodon-binding protein [Spiractinospora alimapuensis]